MSVAVEPVIVEVGDGIIEAFLSGDIDHKNAAAIRYDIDFAIDRHNPKTLVLDFSKVEFMDSSGIGLIMGRFKRLQPIDGRLIVAGASGTIKKVMKIAGIEKLAEIV